MKANGLKPDPEFYIDHQLKNPVGQLFSILVDKLPGARPPARGWSSDPDVQLAERELYAQDYLFKSLLAAKKPGTLLSMWSLAPQNTLKAPVAQTIVRRSTRAAAAAATAAKGQTKMDSFFEARMLVADMKKGRVAKAKKDKGDMN
jgi:hypothetical protein